MANKSVCDAHGPYQIIMKPVFLTISTYLLCLQVTQMLRSSDLAIFVASDKQMDRTDCFISYTCTQGNSMHLMGNGPYAEK